MAKRPKPDITWGPESFGAPFRGPALVCGFGPSLGDDLRAARGLYPAAPVVAVNRAIAAVRSRHVFTFHPEMTGKWRGLAKHYWGTEITVHAGYLKGHARADADHWWEGLGAFRNSGVGAAVFALTAGHETAILCGVGGQADGYYVPGAAADRTWKGKQGAKNAEQVREMAGRVKASDYGPRVFSMSGVTREILGNPPGMRSE